MTDLAEELIEPLLCLRPTRESAFPLLLTGGRSVFDVVGFPAPDDGAALPGHDARPYAPLAICFLDCSLDEMISLRSPSVNQTKYSLEALVRSLTERSMRMQVRFEVVEGVGDLPRRYKDQLRSDNGVVQSLDRLRFAAWRERGRSGFFLRPLLHTYFYWDPRIHHEDPGNGLGNRLGKVGGGWSLSATKCIQRSQREHEDQVSEFESILKGVEQTLNATGMGVRRMMADEMFLELKRAMNPLFSDQIPYTPPELSIDYRSAREQSANTHIEDDQETYIKIGGLLYSFISMKDLPDATFPGILRELLGLDFPMVVNTEVCIPDQADRLKLFEGGCAA